MNGISLFVYAQHYSFMTKTEELLLRTVTVVKRTTNFCMKRNFHYSNWFPICHQMLAFKLKTETCQIQTYFFSFSSLFIPSKFKVNGSIIMILTWWYSSGNVFLSDCCQKFVTSFHNAHELSFSTECGRPITIYTYLCSNSISLALHF